ncbi:MAG TPA: hypothetical protein VF588_20840 [Pyrinomonadaceae bacterium]
MNSNEQLPPTAAPSRPPERAAPRIHGPFPARVRGVDERGARFRGEAALDELSAGDFTLRLPHATAAGHRLFVVIRLCRALVALRGVVLSAEPEPRGGFSLNVSVTRYRFLS